MHDDDEDLYDWEIDDEADEAFLTEEQAEMIRQFVVREKKERAARASLN